jgi:hypothetical protein
MSAIILLPLFFCIWTVQRKSVADAFLDVWLPCLMLLPTYFFFRPKHLPPLIFTDMAAIPIFFAMLVLYAKTWTWRAMDFFLLAYLTIYFIAETRNSGPAVGWLQIYGELTGVLFPYMCGRLLLERPGVRSRFLQRFLILLSVITLLSVWDFVAGVSIFQRFFGWFFPGEVSGWPIQTRWGFGRIAGPYGQAILAGMLFLIGILLSTGMRHFAPTWGTRRLVSFSTLTVRTTILLLLVAGLIMTQSRGPILGVLAGLLIIQIARATNIRRATVIVLVVLLVCLIFGYQYIQDYTAGDLASATTLEQQNAIYRAHLYDAYAQIIHDGGFLGWGESYYPKAPGLDSIDNQYLFLAVTRGYLGLTVFTLMCLGTFWTLFRMIPFATEEADKWLVFTLISIFTGLLLTLTTVFMGAQVYQIFFLFLGWVQALRTPALMKLQAERRARPASVEIYT